MPELDHDTQAALCAIEVEKLYEHLGKGQAKEKGTLTKIKLADRGLNLERLGRHFKLFTNKVPGNGLEGLAEKLQKARQRAQKSPEYGGPVFADAACVSGVGCRWTALFCEHPLYVQWQPAHLSFEATSSMVQARRRNCPLTT